ncbi:rna recognition domain-containing protein [Colletotrichum incanum]|uniref:Rna recognition domain-containing protein n=1 Tax=Colletotrichum incanum TaxID=1573173 RepID=A0A167BA78_COLIC|nr:rna recognition domain-containing protein [Colletotrichum incanum]OHW97820.1 RNA recognition domain-containing protein [Colletotrichum incanum]
MSSSTGNKMLLEHLQKLTVQHEREQAMKTASAPSQTSDSALGRQTTAFDTSSSSSSSLEDADRGGGVKLTGLDAFTAVNNPYALLGEDAASDAHLPAHMDASSLRGSPSSFARRSRTAAQALRPTLSATAAVRTYTYPPQDTDEEDDVFQDTSSSSKKRPTVVSSGSYSIVQGHLQQPSLKGKGLAHRDEYVGGSPSKGGSSYMRNPVDPQATYPTGACIFVANLPEYKDDLTLEAAVIKEFERFGVVFVKIRRDPQGMPFGFCQFTTKENAEDARVNGKGSLILGRPCRTETVRANRTYIIYRRDGTDITMEEANELMRPFGPIETFRVLDPQIRDQLQLPVTIRVQFEVFDPSQQVLRAFRLNKTYKVEPFDFKKAMQARARNSDRAFLDYYDRDRRSIFIGDLPLNFTENDIRMLMEDIGGVVSVQTKRLDYVREGPKLIAFVEFTNVSYPDMAIERYNLNCIEGYTIRVERRTDRRRHDGGMHARNQGTGYNSGYGSNYHAFNAGSNSGKPPSTPARDQRGAMAIEAGPSMSGGQAIQGTPSMMHTASHPVTQAIVMAPTGPPHQTAQPMQHPIQPVQQQMQAQIPHPNQQQVPQMQMQHHGQQYPAQQQMQNQQMATHMAQQQMPQGVQMQQPTGQHMSQAPMQYPMAPPPVPAQVGTPVHNNMAYSPNPFAGSPYSQGAFSQGTGSSFGFVTPQQTPMPFWGYGHGTPLWTPFPVDPAAFAAAAFSSPVRQAHHNVGVAVQSVPAQNDGGQVNSTQSEPVMTENSQAYATEGPVGNN